MIRPFAAAAIAFVIGAALGAGMVWKIERGNGSREARRAAMLAEENARLRTVVTESERAKA
ncbi:MAG TPA: hypothetical protein VFD27_04855, partial [Chthoniobacteraceae bacterium]|nr:hypothetical protein [Chthoniobacteraceae bacterium]